MTQPQVDLRKEHEQLLELEVAPLGEGTDKKSADNCHERSRKRAKSRFLH